MAIFKEKIQIEYFLSIPHQSTPKHPLSGCVPWRSIFNSHQQKLKIKTDGLE